MAFHSPQFPCVVFSFWAYPASQSRQELFCLQALVNSASYFRSRNLPKQQQQQQQHNKKHNKQLKEGNGFFLLSITAWMLIALSCQWLRISWKEVSSLIILMQFECTQCLAKALDTSQEQMLNAQYINHLTVTLNLFDNWGYLKCHILLL